MSAATVAADEPQGTITIEVPEHVLKKMRNQVFRAVDVRNVRGLSQFFGLGAPHALLPLSLPSLHLSRTNRVLFVSSYRRRETVQCTGT